MIWGQAPGAKIEEKRVVDHLHILKLHATNVAGDWRRECGVLAIQHQCLTDTDAMVSQPVLQSATARLHTHSTAGNLGAER